MKLATLPDSALIMALRHNIDVYEYKGIPVARRWPRPRRTQRTQGEIDSSGRFAVAVRLQGAANPKLRELWQDMVVGHGATWMDAARSTALGVGWIEVR